MMISKEEYISLYCNVELYLSSGVIAIDRDKVMRRMSIDPLKTITDLDDYGINGVDHGVAIATPNGMVPLNRKGKDAFGGSYFNAQNRDEDLNMLQDLLFSDEEPSWGSEDSI